CFGASLFVCPFLMLRRPRVPLLPYTTLFRSEGRGFGQAAIARGRLRTGGDEALGDAVFQRVEADHRQAPARTQRRLGGLEPCLQDRKSTRLNSSHVKISYAVFCLKKKRHDLQ